MGKWGLDNYREAENFSESLKDMDRIACSSITCEKVSVTAAGSQMHCKDFFIGNYLLKQGPKGTFTHHEPAFRKSHGMGFASN